MNESEKVFLLPATVDFYSEQLAGLLQQERIDEAIQLLRFLGDCQMDDQQLHMEWTQLRMLLEQEFPAAVEEEAIEEQQMRKLLALQKAEDDISYVDKMAELFLEGGEQQAFALEQMCLLDYEYLEALLIDWLVKAEREPVMQWIVLQELKKRGYAKPIRMLKEAHAVTVYPEAIPVEEESYPAAWRKAGLLAIDVAAQMDLSLVEMIGNSWMELYINQFGTSRYADWLEQLEENPNVWACAIHARVAQIVVGKVDIDALIEAYQLEDVAEEALNDTFAMMKTLK